MIQNRLIWRLLGLAYIGVLAYLLFASPDQLPSIGNWNFFIPADKLVHFCMFLPSPIVLYFSIGKTTTSTLTIVLYSLTCIILAGGTELLQNISPTRSMEGLDFMADCIGIIIGSALLLPVSKKVYEKSKIRSN